MVALTVPDRLSYRECAEPQPCRLCHGSGWFQWSDTPTGPPEWFPCSCDAGERVQQDEAAVTTIDTGLDWDTVPF